MSALRATSLLVVAGLLLLGAGPAAHGHAVAPASAQAGVAPLIADAGSADGCWLCRAGASPIGTIASGAVPHPAEDTSTPRATRRETGGDAACAGIPPTRAPPHSS